VNKGKENKKEKGFLCDLSVYSKNRNFRLYQSSKCGKPEALQLPDFCNFYKCMITANIHLSKGNQIYSQIGANKKCSNIC
jgi:hypothetical protein